MATIKVADNFLLPGLHTAVVHQPDGSCITMMWVPGLTEAEARTQQIIFDNLAQKHLGGGNMRVVKDGEDKG